MPRTKEGVHQNPWLAYMKACAENYKAEKSQPPPAASGKESEPEDAAPKRRVTGKKPVAEAMGEKPKLMKTKPKAKAKPMTKKDEKTVQKVVKAAGKARAKEKAKETAKGKKTN
jgi:hypothetical protein